MARRISPSIERPSMEYLSHLGPNRVAVGDLSVAGLRGTVYSPVSGRDLPAVAIAHGWLQPIARYTDLMRYLASWGFVVVAPDTERGPMPSASGLAVDLTRALRLVATGKLAGGVITADAKKLAVLGHSSGAGAAVLAAAQYKPIKAVVTVTAARSRPTVIQAAGNLTIPSLHLVGDSDGLGDDEGRTLARAWAGPAQLRTISGAAHLGLAEGKHWTTAILGNGSEKRTQAATRTLATAFLLRHLAGHDQLADELESNVPGTSVEALV